MPFSQAVKTRLFTRCGRLCCLCLRQCGTNIEAAHIIAEADGGSNEDDNGIPVCFDCHQEMEAYDPRHPRGNRFQPEELRARRDRVYRLVESGVIYAQLLAQRSRAGIAEAAGQIAVPEAAPREPSTEARLLLEQMHGFFPRLGAAGRRLNLLDAADRAFVIDSLIAETRDSAAAVRALAAITRPDLLSADERRLVLERMLRTITLGDSLASKAAALDELEEDTLQGLDEGVRVAFFEELIEMLLRDQYEEVNRVTGPLVARHRAIPDSLYKSYVVALLDQARSNSWHGAPAARRGLEALPDQIARAGLQAIDANFLLLHGHHGPVRPFVERYLHLASAEQRPLLEDFVRLPFRRFLEKHAPDID